jgi:predicted AAA+ superfamily ATPase
MSKTKFNININRDEPTLNDFLFCWSKFENRPNKVVVYNTYSTKEFNAILSELSSDRTIVTEIIPDDDDYLINDKMFVKIEDGLYISYVQLDRNSDKSIINELCFFYKGDDDFKKIQEIIEKLNSCLVDFCEEQSDRVNTLAIGPNGLEIEPMSSLEVDIDNIELFYNAKTFKNLKKMIKSIKKSKKGLNILYGERGTGKTSLINYLSTSIDRMIIFIPNNMIDSTINNPEFKRFLRRYPSPIIILDDCEMMFNESYARSNILVNNLIQLIDGFLSDSIEVQIITLFNVDSDSRIDHTLLDCNNLIDVVEFNRLTSDEATELSKYLDKSKKYKSSTRLIDVIKNRKEKDIVEIGVL